MSTEADIYLTDCGEGGELDGYTQDLLDLSGEERGVIIRRGEVALVFRVGDCDHPEDVSHLPILGGEDDEDTGEEHALEKGLLRGNWKEIKVETEGDCTCGIAGLSQRLQEGEITFVDLGEDESKEQNTS